MKRKKRKQFDVVNFKRHVLDTIFIVLFCFAFLLLLCCSLSFVCRILCYLPNLRQLDERQRQDKTKPNTLLQQEESAVVKR